MGGIDLADPVHRLVLLANPAPASPADKILALAGGAHQDILAKLEEQQAQTIIGAYQAAREQLTGRMEQIYNQTFGAGVNPEPKDMIEWARNEELLGNIDTHLDALGVTTQALQGQAWAAGASLGLSQANTELGLALPDFGLAARTFGDLNTLVPDLGMATAINETKNLSNELKTEVHSQLTQGAVLGEGIGKIQARVDGVLGGELTAGGQNRAELISRWATVKGYNAAADQAINDASALIPGLLECWIVEADELTCPDCMAHWGEVIEPDAEFDSARSFAGTPITPYGGTLEYPPLHPRCRCTISAWHPRWEDLSSVTPTEMEANAQQLAASNGFPPKSFVPPNPPEPGTLRATRAGRQVIRAQSIASIPEGVRQATLNRFLQCWVGG